MNFQNIENLIEDNNVSNLCIENQQIIITYNNPQKRRETKNGDYAQSLQQIETELFKQTKRPLTKNFPVNTYLINHNGRNLHIVIYKEDYLDKKNTHDFVSIRKL